MGWGTGNGAIDMKRLLSEKSTVGKNAFNFSSIFYLDTFYMSYLKI